MGQALYRKYRSKSFDDVVGQDHITKTLQNAISQGKISHAYLFTGPRGVGKTSVARILAHEVNAIPYKDESIHLDIIEIDAASNRRIDEIRDLREKVGIAPAIAKYKVYIIDEVHMLTREAFNALLKTLEEPPSHCIFILATTEAHKLPETIISRTQRFEFKPINAAQAAEHMSTIAKHEKIDIDRHALELLAKFGAGSFRDSISYLDQLSSYKKTITTDDVMELLGIPASDELSKLLHAISAGRQSEIINLLSNIEAKGVTPTAVAEGISELIRQNVASDKAKSWQIELMNSLINVSASHRPQDFLEITLLSANSSLVNNQENTAPPPAAQKKESQTNNFKPADKTHKTTPNEKANSDFNLDIWEDVLLSAKSEAASIYTALRLADPLLQDGKLILNFQFPLHQKKLEQAKNKALVQKIIMNLCGQELEIKSVVSKKQQLPKLDQPEPEISSISNIFGNAEVIEA